MAKYMTEQRKNLQMFFSEHFDQAFTIEQLHAALPGISLSALYRNIGRMVDEGAVRSQPQQGSRKLMYQFVGEGECASSIHLHCRSCGGILHLDERATQQVMAAVQQTAHFTMDLHSTILCGTCVHCK